MKITLNGKALELEAPLTVQQLLELKNYSLKGTAVAIGDRHVPHQLWDKTTIQAGDDVTVISAAYGG